MWYSNQKNKNIISCMSIVWCNNNGSSRRKMSAFMKAPIHSTCACLCECLYNDDGHSIFLFSFGLNSNHTRVYPLYLSKISSVHFLLLFCSYSFLLPNPFVCQQNYFHSNFFVFYLAEPRIHNNRGKARGEKNIVAKIHPVTIQHLKYAHI